MRAGILFTLTMIAVLALCSFVAAEPALMVMQDDDDDFPGLQAKGSYLGIDPGEVTSENAPALKMKEETGVEVKMVDNDAPAGKAGLKEHDVILTLNGQKVEGVDQLRRILSETPGGRSVKVGISRNGQYMELPVTLASKKKMTASKFRLLTPGVPPSAPMVAPMPPMQMGDFDFPPNINIVMQSASRNGLMVESLTPQLAEYFGVKRGEGVLVRGVDHGSAAATAGLRAGDVIVSVDKEQIGDVGDWRRVMRGKAGTVTVGIIRDKRQQNVPMKLPAHKTREQGSIAVPDVELGDLDVDIDTDELREQLKNLKPQIERQSRMIAMQLEKQRPEIEKAVRDAQQQINRVEIQKELEKAQAEIAKIDVEKIRREALEQFNKTDFKEMQKELQKEMEQLQKQMREQQDSFRFEMISY